MSIPLSQLTTDLQMLQNTVAGLPAAIEAAVTSAQAGETADFTTQDNIVTAINTALQGLPGQVSAALVAQAAPAPAPVVLPAPAAPSA